MNAEDSYRLDRLWQDKSLTPMRIGVVAPLTLEVSTNDQVIGFDSSALNNWFIAEILSSETVDNLGLSDFASSGTIGSAGTTVDIYDRFIFDQDTSGVTVDVPDPTTPVDGQLIYFINRGTNSIIVNNGTDDFTVIVNGALTLEWSDDDGQWIENTELVDYDFKAYSWVERIQNSAGVWQNGNKSGTLNAYRAEPSTGAYQTVPDNSVVLMKSSSSIGGEYEFIWNDGSTECCDTIETELCGRITNVCPIPIWAVINDGVIETSDTELPGYALFPGGGGITIERHGYCGGVITDATWASSIATITVASHPLSAGDTVTISGVDPEGYNGTFTVDSVVDGAFNITIFADPGTYVDGGTVDAPEVIYCEDNPEDCCDDGVTSIVLACCEPYTFTVNRPLQYGFSATSGAFTTLPATLTIPETGSGAWEFDGSKYIAGNEGIVTIEGANYLTLRIYVGCYTEDFISYTPVVKINAEGSCTFTYAGFSADWTYTDGSTVILNGFPGIYREWTCTESNITWSPSAEDLGTISIGSGCAVSGSFDLTISSV